METSKSSLTNDGGNVRGLLEAYDKLSAVCEFVARSTMKRSVSAEMER